MKALALLLLSAVAHAAPLDVRVTVQVTNAPLTTVLDTISKQYKVNFILTEGFQDRRVSSDLKDVKLSEALRSVLEPAGFSYRRVGNGDLYLVTRKGARPAGKVSINKDSPALQARATIKVTAAPLRALFDTIAAQAKLSFTVAPEIESRQVTVDLPNVAVRELLEILAEFKGLNIKQTGKDKFSVSASPKK